MKKDISFNKPDGIALAIVPKNNPLTPFSKGKGEHREMWDCYLLNLKEDSIETVLVTSKGYGILNGKNVKTSILRHLIPIIKPNKYAKIELIQKKLFGLSHEFWVSFWRNGSLFDKKYIFVSESITKQNFTPIPLINAEGVMIK